MIERWKAVIGYEGLYEVSCLGRVRSLDTIDSFGRKHGNGRISSCCKHRRGAKTCGGYHWRYV